MVRDVKNKIVERIKKEFSSNVDLVIKPIKINSLKTIYVVYLESVSGSDKINDYILKNLTILNALKKSTLKNISYLIPAPNTVIIDNYDKIEFYITNGFTIVPESTTEQAVYGPKDAFTENIQINLGLVKRRIKSHTLKSLAYVVGRKTTTMLNVLYFSDIASMDNVNEVIKTIKEIDIDGITDSGSLAKFFELDNNSHFPTVLKTERPDTVATALLAGKIAILVDTSPFALILPAFFGDFINPITDNYSIPKNINFLKILRLSCLIFTMVVPGLYIAIINFNPEVIPTSLLINFAIQRSDVPFPTIVEAFIMLLLCEILRESDFRFPSSYGSAISILGALIIGEAAVSAGIVSPIMIIVIAFTFITSLIFPEQELNSAIRKWRWIFLLLATVLGLYGIVLAIIYFLINITEITSIKNPYFYPIAPYDKNYLHESLFKVKISKDTKRSSLLARKNMKKQGRNKV